MTFFPEFRTTIISFGSETFFFLSFSNKAYKAVSYCFFKFYSLFRIIWCLIVKYTWQFQLLDKQKWKPGGIKQIKGIYFVFLNENSLDVPVLA